MATHVLWVLVAVLTDVLSVQPPSTDYAFQRRLRRSGNGVCGDPHVAAGSDPVTLSSPGFPNFYPANSRCSWSVTASQGKRINITAKTFSVEHSMKCQFDHLVVYDGADRESEVLGRFCGNSVFSVSTTSNRAFVVFIADISYEGIGFELKVSTAAGLIKGRTLTTPDCNSTFTSGPQTITSPNFPLPADHNTYCTYHIQAPAGKIVQLIFNFFHLELCRHCSCDYLEVYDGNNTDDDSESRFCGHHLPELVRSRGRDVLVVFRMDHMFRRAGFNATFSFVSPDFDPYHVASGAKDCSGLLTTAGELTSPGYPAYYPVNKVCVSVLQAPKGQYVKLDVQEFRLEGNSTDSCSDSVTISDPQEIRHRQSFRLCGDTPVPRTVTSFSNVLVVRFQSDQSFVNTGYVFNYTFVEGSGCRLPCQNDGECILEDGKPVCECLPPFSGDLCEIRPSSCGQDPCQNRASCDPIGDTYRCTCSEGFRGEHCNIDVRKDLMFEHTPKNKTGRVANSAVTLQCSVNWKQAKLTWKFNSRDLFKSMSDRLGVVVYGRGVLGIPSLNPGNAGRYTCLATDDRGDSIQHDAWVTLAQDCKRKIVKPPADTEERHHRQSHVFECESNDHDVTYTWLKDGVPVKYDTRVTKLVNNFLLIKNVSFEDAGEYTCEVQDSSGCVDRASAELTVLGTGDISNVCGQPKLSFPGDISNPLRIIGGKKARKGAYPWHVFFVNKDKGEVFCGGSIVDEHWVVTAAHCITDKSHFSLATTRLYTGSHKCKEFDRMTVSVGMELTMDGPPTVHEHFDDVTFDNDIALVRVREAIVFNSDIQPLCLQSRSVVERFIRQRSVGHIVGCGLTGLRSTPNELREIKLPIRHEDDCQKSLSGNYVMTDSMICAGFNSGTGDSCKGDSGGALVAKLSGRYTLVGIVSWGIDCARPGQYGFYTNAARFFGWMHRTMQ